VVVSNKSNARDPEGETILRELIHKSGYGNISEVHASKLLTVKVEASNARTAKELVLKMCNDLRIFNPAAHSLRVELG
jgi:phosphoribosylformylglycinamidine synthase subunit PurS